MNSVMTIPAQRGAGFILRKGQELKVIDPRGEQVADLFCFDLDDPSDALSSGRTIDDNETIYMTKGHRLSGNSGRIMMTIVEDTCGRHDFLLTPCSLLMFQTMAGNREHHPSCLQNLCENLAAFGIDPMKIGTTFNIFMNVTVAEDGKTRILPPRTKAGDYVVLRAERDLIVGLTACSDEGTNNGICKPIEFEILPAKDLA